MSFKDNINRICKEQGTTLTAVVKGLGLSTSKVSRWNDGSLPKEDVMLLLAKELHCSVMDFFADEEDLQNPEPQNEDEQDILSMFRSLTRREKHEFMAMVYDFERRKELEGDKSDDTREQGNSNGVAV